MLWLAKLAITTIAASLVLVVSMLLGFPQWVCWYLAGIMVGNGMAEKPLFAMPAIRGRG